MIYQQLISIVELAKMSVFGKVKQMLHLLVIVCVFCLYSSALSATGQARFLTNLYAAGEDQGRYPNGSRANRVLMADVFGKSYISSLQSWWAVDGSSSGTQKLPLSDAQIDVRDLKFNSVNQGVVYFSSRSIFEGQSGFLISTDGTAAGTKVVKKFSTPFIDRAGSFDGITPIFWQGGTGYFSGVNGATGEELWRTDGTAAGTTLVKDISPGLGTPDPVEGTSYPNSSKPSNFFESDGTIYFVAANGLYQTDGSEMGTTASASVTDIRNIVYSDPNVLIYLTLAKDLMLLNTANGEPFTPVVLGSNFFSVDTFNNAVLWNNTLYFVARKNGESFGSELWTSDLSAGSAQQLKDIRVGAAGSSIDLYSNKHLVNNGQELVFSAADGINGVEPWKTDGTSEGTQLIKNVRAGTGPSITDGASSAPIVFNDRVLFTLYEDATGFEFWATDGSNSGTRLIKDIKPGLGSSFFFGRFYQNVNGRFYFSANNGVNGPQIWTTDLSSTGTQMIDILNGGDVRFLRSRGPNTLLFTTYKTDEGLSLWAYDLDVDGDNRIDVDDNCPEQANANQLNLDSDGFGDVCDDDADNDGLPAEWEQMFGLNDLDSRDASLDSDGDGISNTNEYLAGTNPQVANPDCNKDGIADESDKCVIMAPIFMLLDSKNSVPTFSVEEGRFPGLANLILSDDKTNFDYVIEQLQTEDAIGLPLDPPLSPTFITGNSGNKRVLIIEVSLPFQSGWRFTATVTDSDSEVLEQAISFGVP